MTHKTKKKEFWAFFFSSVMNTTKQNQQNNKSTRFKYEKRKYNIFELGIGEQSKPQCVWWRRTRQLASMVEMRIASFCLRLSLQFYCLFLPPAKALTTHLWMFFLESSVFSAEIKIIHRFAYAIHFRGETFSSTKINFSRWKLFYIFG